MKKIYALFLIVIAAGQGFGQSTFNRVYTILQSNCAATCHSNATHAGNLDLSGTEQTVWSALVGVTPSNSTSAGMGNKLVDPGFPENSFLFKKIHRGLDFNLSLTAGENPTTHDTLTALTKVEREMIRQWIMFDAKDTGVLVNEQTIVDFYVGQGGEPRVQPLAPPAPNEGVQLHWGPLFMPVGLEFEYSKKFPVKNSGTADVTRMNVVENDESHHFALYKFNPGRDSSFPNGMDKINGIISEAALFYSASVIAQWPNNIDLVYPQGTAYVWAPNTYVNITYHLINYNDSIIAAEAYMNVYYSPHQASTIPIQTAQIRYGGDNVTQLVIPNNNQDTTFTIVDYSPDSAFLWNVISMQAHTHALGTDYNVWMRNSDGSKGDLVYDGSYNANYTFDQGVYVWSNPPYRQFTPPMPVDMTKGMIHEATFRNAGVDTVGFGLTTADEMYVTFIVYYKSDYLGVNDEGALTRRLRFYPNPTKNSARVSVDKDVVLSDATFALYDLLGNKVKETQGINQQEFTVDMSNLTNGCYIYKLSDGGNVSSTGKVIVQQ